MKFIKLIIILTLFCINISKGQTYKGPLFENCKLSDPSEVDSCNKQEILQYIKRELYSDILEFKKSTQPQDLTLIFEIENGSVYNIKIQGISATGYYKTLAQPLSFNNKLNGFLSEKEFKISYQMPKDVTEEFYKLKIFLNDGELYKVVEQMPRFPGCEGEDLETEAEKKSCADAKMLDYIYTNLVYPAEAFEKKVNGGLVIQFVIETDGYISEINVVRGIGYGCDQAAIDIIESMNTLGEAWRPGHQRGKPVRVLYTLPIKFDTQKKDTQKKNKNYPSLKN